MKNCPQMNFSKSYFHLKKLIEDGDKLLKRHQIQFGRI
ncbi:hypothetical protein Cdeb_01253 [Caldibacillus debilis GB1]|uniref:Uncharacterized protein n=1 Tax=Caldibacillus debilis GB1 TaxID=1339248 RepID=A0A420VE31_9BACI|nr:hypothetical protein Cdeb_01253 [Caldibacillus debilis GB1]